MVYYNEIDPYAAQWLRNLISAGHIAKGDVDERSIKDVKPDDLRGYTQCHFFAGIGIWSYALRRSGWPDDRPVWTGSCPCQPFSAAGKGGGFADERHLWPAFFHLIGERRPVVVLGEQVASQDGLAWLDLVQADMEGAGYAVGAVDTCAAGFGAPHIRQRLYWVGHADEGRGRRHAGAVSGAEEEARRRVRGVADGAEPAGADGELADAGHEGLQVGSVADGRRGAVRLEGPAAAPNVVSCELADTGAPGCGEHQERDRQPGAWVESPCRDDFARRGEPVRPGPVNGLWRTADWLYCRDGKWRPVEGGTFPLAHGDTARVGRLRAYGNAIVPQLAAEFIRAADESLNDAIRSA